MEVPESRRWMYNRINRSTKWVTIDFERGVEEFLDYANKSPYSQRVGKLRCPCVNCECRPYRTFDEVKTHLYSEGFMPDYYIWTSHGETEEEYHLPMTQIPSEPHASHGPLSNQQAQYETMVMDVAGPSFRDNNCNGDEEMPNPNARAFYDMLHAAQQPLWEGCEESQLWFLL